MLALVGISYKTAPIEARECLAFTKSELAALLPALHTRFGAVAMLSTCNRTEVYLAGDGRAAQVGELVTFLSRYRDTETRRQMSEDGPSRLSPSESPLRPVRSASGGRTVTNSSLNPAFDPAQFYYLESGDAIRHLLRVASGLDSMLLGEVQILGQVRGALLAAEQAGSADGLLIRLFQSAVATGRKARTTAGLGRFAASAGRAAVELARQVCGDLRGCSVLVVSAGEAGKLTAQALRDAGAGQITVTSRTLARAEALASQLGGTTLPYGCLADGIAGADIVISATGSRGFQIDQPMIERAMLGRSDRPLLLIDLAVPRDVDPAVRNVRGVQLHDIDGLQYAEEDGATDRLCAVEEAERLVTLEVDRFLRWWQSRRAVPTISALRDQAEAIRCAELAKTLGRLPNLSEEERGRIDALTAAIVRKLLHQPIARLKASESDPHYLAAVADLFALPAEATD